MRWECSPTLEFGWNLLEPASGNRSRRGGPRVHGTMTSSGQPRSRKRFSRLRAGKKFAGGKAAKDGWSPAFGRVACRPPMDFMKVVALANRSGYWWNGRRRPPSRPSISSATSLPTTAFGASSKWPNRAGKSSRIINNSRKNSDWTTTRVAVGVGHHHVTLVMLAHGFLTLETLRNQKNFWLDPAEDAS